MCLYCILFCAHQRRKTKHFYPSRGLRQGDPLSPYLFILCQEVFSRLIDREHAAGNMRGVKMNVRGLDFTNVMFTDDIMLFSKATCKDVLILNSCLEKYCAWSGQAVNRSKSGIIFSKMVNLNHKRRLKEAVQMKKVPANSKYLGSPLFTTRSRAKDFNYLQEKLESRLNGWRSKSLSWAGRCTLIKSVAQAIPSYTFSTFDVPTIVCDKLDSTTRRFWWNPKKSKGRYLAWKSWDHLCKPKICGGLGFKKAKKFNEAFIAKLTWMIASKRSSPCMDALRSKYKVTDRWLWEEPRKSASYTWKALEKMKLLIKKGACFLIGDGLSIDVWAEPWFPWLPNFAPKPKSSSINTWPLKVADLIDQNWRCWINSRLLELRAILFGSPWAIHSHCISIPTCMDIIRFICEPHINPTSPSLSIELSKYSAIQFAITLDCIWNIRNQVVHNDYKINLLAQIKNLECRVMEHIHAIDYSDDAVVKPLKINNTWIAPSPGTIKVNVDAAIFNDKVAVAVVARNHRGYINNAWTKPVEFSDPTVAEASAICWALDLSKDARFESICIESDAKVCIEALTGPLPHCPWKIQALVNQSLNLACCFSFCSFNWVRRNANQVAHALA